METKENAKDILLMKSNNKAKKFFHPTPLLTMKLMKEIKFSFLMSYPSMSLLALPTNLSHSSNTATFTKEVFTNRGKIIRRESEAIISVLRKFRRRSDVQLRKKNDSRANKNERQMELNCEIGFFLHYHPGPYLIRMHYGSYSLYIVLF